MSEKAKEDKPKTRKLKLRSKPKRSSGETTMSTRESRSGTVRTAATVAATVAIASAEPQASSSPASCHIESSSTPKKVSTHLSSKKRHASPSRKTYSKAQKSTMPPLGDSEVTPTEKSEEEEYSLADLQAELEDTSQESFEAQAQKRIKISAPDVKAEDVHTEEIVEPEVIISEVEIHKIPEAGSTSSQETVLIECGETSESFEAEDQGTSEADPQYSQDFESESQKDCDKEKPKEEMPQILFEERQDSETAMPSIVSTVTMAGKPLPPQTVELPDELEPADLDTPKESSPDQMEIVLPKPPKEDSGSSDTIEISDSLDSSGTSTLSAEQDLLKSQPHSIDNSSNKQTNSSDLDDTDDDKVGTSKPSMPRPLT